MKTEHNPTHMPAVQVRDHLGDRAPYHALVTVSMDREGLVHLSAHRDGDDRDSITADLTIDQAARVYALLGRAIGAQAIDVEHLAHQAAWSAETFGPGSRMGGVSDHIRKELDTEVREGHPDEDPSEWIDVIILAFDGAWRSGLLPSQIIAGIKAKQARNEARTWPDWRTAEPGKAIEHDRSKDRDGALGEDERWARRLLARHFRAMATAVNVTDWPAYIRLCADTQEDGTAWFDRTMLAASPGVLALHQSLGGQNVWCGYDGEHWPCATVRAAGGGQP